MLRDIEDIKKTAQEEINQAADSSALEGLRVKYLGRKGVVSQIFAELPGLSGEEKAKTGKLANELKIFFTELINSKTQQLRTTNHEPRTTGLDITLPGIKPEIGHKHPLTQILEEICAIFSRMGFNIIESPEIETEFNNFTALNIPLDHPSRDAFDTFYLKTQINTDEKNYRLTQMKSLEKLLLRSHTSPGQIRVMKEHKPPLAVVVPGKVYRPDAVDASHSFMFHQVEGFLVDENIRFSDLKGVLTNFAQELFGKEIKMRFRPHFFPFTEPSAEVDISCVMCKGKGCSVCGRKGWLEILGSGMIHPNVFKAAGYPLGKFTGFAFGMGAERIAMLKFGINDIRLFFENDLRFLRQF
jgi:phenylalanyl-tRNA synthetase alpha chain